MKANLPLKLIAITVISIGLILLLQMIEYKISERQEYQNAAKASIAQGWSDKQLVVPPTLRLTLRKYYTREVFDENLKRYVTKKLSKEWNEFHVADDLFIKGDIALQERYKGIYKVPVYETQLYIEGTFAAINKTQAEVVDVQLISSFSDMRGISNTPSLVWNSKPVELETGKDKQLLGDYISGKINDFDVKSEHEFSMTFALRGLDELRFVPNAKQVSVILNSAWEHPYFTGRYLPNSRKVNKDGFNAQWNMSEFATSIQQSISECSTKNECTDSLSENAFGVGMHNPIDIYQKTDRSLKYAFLFILLTFVVFCLFEAIKQIKIHPIQYALVGAALALFYLLLIAFSEHMSFGFAYLIATIFCISLIFFYLIYVLGNRSIALTMSGGMLSLYAMLYMILKSEDYALLMGAMLTFLSLGGLMVATRNIDWYQLAKKDDHVDQSESE